MQLEGNARRTMRQQRNNTDPVADYPEWIHVRGDQFHHGDVVQSQPGYGLSALGVCELRHRIVPVPDF